jgi:hypothetical protein
VSLPDLLRAVRAGLRGLRLPAVATALAKLVHHVVPVSMHDMGGMVEMVSEMHDDLLLSKKKDD